MGDGLKRVHLLILCSRGPWTNTKSSPDTWSLTGEEVHALYYSIGQGRVAMLSALGVSALGHGKANKALQLLRRAKLIRFARKTQTWEHT